MKLRKSLRSNEPYLIAETAYSHEGDFNYLEKQILDIIKTNVDAVKFHVMFDKNDYFIEQHELFAKWDEFLFSEEQWLYLMKRLKNNNKEIIVLADDVKAVEFLYKNPDLVDGVEIHAACINDPILLKEILKFTKKFHKIFIAGISGLEIDEIFTLNDILANEEIEDVLFMYGFQNYPTDYKKIKMSNINHMSRIFNRKIGYADHTETNDKYKKDIIILAIGVGANIIEVHYKLNNEDERIDGITALNSKKLHEIKNDMVLLSKVLGNPDFRMNEDEKKYSKYRKSCMYKNNFEKGHVIKEEDLVFKRINNPENIMKINEYKQFLGRKLSQNVKKYTIINKNHFMKKGEEND
ncbi:N-acetylneuraminate synthase family protein [Petrotoga sp. Shatin.DS.tank11.9.2.9.3]|uniref:N-acetylneuraminate synthase family protein n=1 Tax=Petrotoga sp. Shatin.DS.tank11.9.2.9.3 TaxID=1469556 RepID=UPI000FED387D|nr:N-acetylneuraminate synthase family protein [Petrotoga sp. Shatin.DS.tank11.9.2.9.3]RLL85240.1 hypothetical protein BZ25_02675 [Petrotoga sp. Shatin.DS.tank11.9.2.9.3]